VLLTEKEEILCQQTKTERIPVAVAALAVKEPAVVKELAAALAVALAAAAALAVKEPAAAVALAVKGPAAVVVPVAAKAALAEAANANLF
jgi:hypothetical protein